MPDQSDAPQSVAASAEQLPPAIRELHRAVLRGFRDSGQVHRDDLRPTAAALGVDLDDALHQLGSADLVHSAPDGQIEVAYPFSRQPTGHTVHLTGHPPVAAMCAIDALGIPLMTGTDGVIDSADPDTGTPIRIHRHSDQWTWQPATAVVVIAQTDCSGTLADTLCGSITFHTRSYVFIASAWHAWTVSNPNDTTANIRLPINVMAAYVVSDDAELSWSKAEDAMRQEQCRQKGKQ
jgi:alkylmercury lyase